MVQEVGQMIRIPIDPISIQDLSKIINSVRFNIEQFQVQFKSVPFLSIILHFVDAFDREYRLAFSQLGHRDLARLRVYDRPPNNAITRCRRIFSDLEL